LSHSATEYPSLTSNAGILPDRLRITMVRAFAMLTIVVAVMVLAGWAFYIQALVGIMPGLPTMKVNTAICFLLTGVTILLYISNRGDTRGYYILRNILLALVFAIAAGTLVQYYFSVNLGIDEFPVTDVYSRLEPSNGRYPGRMAHATAISFLLIAVAQLLSPARRPALKEFIQALWLSVGVVAFVAILGYVFGVPSLYKISFFSSMAVHTSFLMLALSFAGSLMHPDSGFMGLFLSRQVGGVMLRQVVPVLTLTAIVFGYIRLYAYRHDTVPDEFGIALAAVLYLIIAVSAVAFTAMRLNKTDVIRQQAEGDLANLNDNLEQILAQRSLELQISEGKFRNAFNYSAVGMALVSSERKWIEVNNALCKILGYTPDEFYQLSFQDITYPDDLDTDLPQLKQILAGQLDTYRIEKRYFHKNGSLVWAKLSVSMLRNADGSPFCFLSQVEDVTAQKMAEKQLVEVNRELTAILDSATHVSIIGTDTQGVITHFSRGSENLLGYGACELIEKHTPQIIHVEEEVTARGKKLSELYGKEVAGFDVFVERARREKYDAREWTYVRKDGTKFPVHLVVTAVRGANGEITGFLGVATDLTEAKKAEAQQLKVVELEAKNKEMEQFNYIASHDLQEPLRTVNNLTEMLQTRYANMLDEEGRQMLDFTRGSALRMSELIAGLLFYSRLGKERKMELFNCTEVVQEVLLDIQESLRESGGKIEVEELPELNGFKLEFRILMQNLLSNAVKFRQKDVPLQVKISCKMEGNNHRFCVCDNGIGIQEKDLQKVFILFKRLHNREDYSGIGIGLAHCKKIVELHGGNIWVESIPGKGSSFYFTIPA
jgi:PAS domain S-box-containing protein